MMELIDKIQKKLQKPLPAETAHKAMVPYKYKETFHQFEKPNPRACGVLLLLYFHQGEWYMPLIVRSSNERGVHSGQVAFPGGKKEETDKDIVFTALRETQEEIGVDHEAEGVKIIGQLTKTYVSSHFIIHPSVAYLPHKPKMILDPVEVDQILEIKLSDLLDPNNLKDTTLKTKYEDALKTPFFDLKNQVVWGATAMVLNEFRMLVNSTNTDR